MKSIIKPKICGICKKNIIIDENHLGTMIGPDQKGLYYHLKCHSPHLLVEDISQTDLTVHTGSDHWKFLQDTKNRAEHEG